MIILYYNVIVNNDIVKIYIVWVFLHDLFLQQHIYWEHVAVAVNKKAEHNTEATWENHLEGDMYWPTAKRVAIKQQEHPTWKGKSAPTVWQGPGNTSREGDDAEFVKIKQSLSSNYYNCLSPPPCQVEEHELSTTRKSTVKFKTTIDIAPTVPQEYANTIAQR